MNGNEIFTGMLPCGGPDVMGIHSSSSQVFSNSAPNLYPGSFDPVDANRESGIMVGYPVVQGDFGYGFQRNGDCVDNAVVSIDRDPLTASGAIQNFTDYMSLQEQFTRASQVNLFSTGFFISENPKQDWNSENCNVYENGSYGCGIPRKDLLLSLTMGNPSISHGALDQCTNYQSSNMRGIQYPTHGETSQLQNSSCVSQFSLENAGFQKVMQSELSSSSAEYFQNQGSYKTVRFPNFFLGSRYLSAAHQVLSEVFSGCAFMVQDLCNHGNASLHDEAGSSIDMCKTSSGSAERGSMILDPEIFSDRPGESSRWAEQHDFFQSLDPENRKAGLLTLLQQIDQRYTECQDQIQTVISSFQTATDVDPPQMCIRLALQMVCNRFKSVRKKIEDQVLVYGQYTPERLTEKSNCLSPTSVQKQWALQHLQKAEQVPWRPQRGLPERSVAVLRAWLFENFLHPYPKDHQKYVLAKQSGLTKSQVSNWFINARVRIWKPMIEEMYMELNKKSKATNESFLRSREMERGTSALRNS